MLPAPPFCVGSVFSPDRLLPVMGGESRLCVHGVPRILSNTLPSDLKAAAEVPLCCVCGSHLIAALHSQRKESLPRGYHPMVLEYLQTARINLNARQVWWLGCDLPPSRTSL